MKSSAVERPSPLLPEPTTGKQPGRCEVGVPAGGCGLGGLGLLMLSAQTSAPNPVFQAMRDEMDRARKLALASLEAPYFVEYLIDEEENFSVAANLGGLLSRRKDRFRSPDSHIRVGDYKFDNSNYVGSGFGFGSLRPERFPLEDSTRCCPYLADHHSSYKSVVEAISCMPRRNMRRTSSSTITPMLAFRSVRLSAPVDEGKQWLRALRFPPSSRSSRSKLQRGKWMPARAASTC
jgi:hypothetical protein